MQQLITKQNLLDKVQAKYGEISEAIQQIQEKVCIIVMMSVYNNMYLNLQEEELQSCEMEKQAVRQQLVSKEAELTRAEETIRRQQEQIQEMRQRVSLVCVVTKGCTVTAGD